MPNHILHINASARIAGSQSRVLSEKLINRLRTAGAQITQRDIGQTPPQIITEDWVTANFTPEEDRTAQQREILAPSDRLVAEIEAADTLVIGLPIYNFGVPAAFKAWVDQIARAGRTFKYSASGPVGLLEGKKAYIVIASGGTKSGSEIDFATPYIRHVLGFIGITDVEIITADQLALDPEATLKAANEAIEQLAA
ncbi:NAD(P)H-dependent oxidoreductase [Hyphomonas sp. FCG-A18]|jgi:FMN-dependent NADH-azoreductase|uniref:FMN-dependent NADH-azoreductase n=1 Tax=Hyphomonas sp. FCG-A18 TaxID=3080019 RepID=UPI002B2D7EDD|nr:NAD(P)H-dependent oxidoreductase [Hyphomonas sp. FCG-A18]